MSTTFSDATVMAYADGELTGPEREALEAALADDPELRARVEEHQGLRALLSGAHAGALDEPVPERLLAAVRGAPTAEVVSLETRRRPRLSPGLDWRAAAAMAACLIVGVTAGALWRGGATPLIRTEDGRLTAAGGLDRALDRQLAADDGVVKVGLSFRDGEGDYCRTFRTGEGLAGLACREDGDWRVRMTLATDAPAASGGYRTAGTDTPPEILTAVEATIDGAPLDAAAEAAARDRGWK